MSLFRYVGTLALALLLLLVPSGMAAHAQSVGFTFSTPSATATTEAGGTVTFTVVLNTKPTANVSIDLVSSDTDEATVSPGTLTFTTANWNNPQRVTVTGVNDFLVDGNIAYTILTLPATSGDKAYNNLNPADVALTNNDNDTVGFIVTPTSGLTTSETGGTANFTVALSSKPTRNVNIPVSSDNVNEGVPSTTLLVFTPGNWNVAQTVNVRGVADTATDGAKAYKIVLGAAISGDKGSAGPPVIPGYNGQDPADVNVTNLDNDSSGFTITPLTGLVTTEKGGTTSFTIKLNSQPTQNVTIGLSSSDTTEGTVSPASVVFTSANWNVAQRVTVTGVNDSFVDGNKNYTIVTAAATSTDAAYNGRNPADVAVLNRDDETIVFSPAAVNITESVANATFTVVLSGSPETGFPVAVTYQTVDKTALAGSDYTATSGTLTFNPGETSKTIAVTINNDTIGEDNESFNVRLNTATNGALNGTPVVNGIILANDKVSFASATYTGAESARQAVITVKLNGADTARATTVNYSTSNDTATTPATGTNPSDYTAVTNGSVTFAAGETTKTFTVVINDDTLGEPNEQFKVTLSLPTTPNASLGSIATTTVIIPTNDPAMFSANSYTVNENTGNAIVTVRLTGGALGSAVSVNYATSDVTALGGADYTATSGTLTFAAGETSKTISIPIREDAIQESDESFRVTLSSPVNTVLGNPNFTTVVIKANDTIGFQFDTYSVIEYEPYGIVTVTLNAPSADTVTVNYATSNGTATAGSDYSATSGTLTFVPGETSKSFSIPITDDTALESSETINLTLSSPTKAVLGRTTAILTIIDNE